MTRQQKQTPTQTIKNWISEFVTKPNPVFGNLPPCPFAQKAIIENKVEFLELDGVAQPDQFTADETEKLARDLNGYFMDHDVVVLEDHPDTPESVKGVKLNNGEYILFLAQRLSKLNKFAKILEAGPYYKNWSKDYLESVKGFRYRKR